MQKIISNEVAQCRGPTTLRHLRIENVKSLVSLPRELRHAPALQSLAIGYCPSLVSLPEWIADLPSFQTLKKYGCPRLEERCEEGTGEDWPKIAHIPNISNDWV